MAPLDISGSRAGDFCAPPPKGEGRESGGPRGGFWHGSEEEEEEVGSKPPQEKGGTDPKSGRMGPPPPPSGHRLAVLTSETRCDGLSVKGVGDRIDGRAFKGPCDHRNLGPLRKLLDGSEGM